jgi:uncharacterized protein YgiM (DUF1202 family)
MAHIASWNRNAAKAVAAGVLLLALLAIAAVRGPAAGAASTLNPWSAPAAGPAAPLLRVTAASEVRSGPGSAYLILAVTFPGESLPVLGKSADGRWWRVDVGGQAGWLQATAPAPGPAANLGAVEVAGVPAIFPH